MKKTQIEDLIKLIQDTSITELSWSEGETSITLKQGSAGHAIVPVPAPQPVQAAPAPAAAEPAAPVSQAAAASNLHEVKSPMVGTFYESPNPDSAPFVAVGDKVKKGQVLCIIEAMKLMNEIESDKDGVIEEIVVANESPVEFDTVLFRIA